MEVELQSSMAAKRSGFNRTKSPQPVEETKTEKYEIVGRIPLHEVEKVQIIQRDFAMLACFKKQTGQVNIVRMMFLFLK
jgi:hypothetical protein